MRRVRATPRWTRWSATALARCALSQSLKDTDLADRRTLRSPPGRCWRPGTWRSDRGRRARSRRASTCRPRSGASRAHRPPGAWARGRPPGPGSRPESPARPGTLPQRWGGGIRDPGCGGAVVRVVARTEREPVPVGPLDREPGYLDHLELHAHRLAGGGVELELATHPEHVVLHVREGVRVAHQTGLHVELVAPRLDDVRVDRHGGIRVRGRQRHRQRDAVEQHLQLLVSQPGRLARADRDLEQAPLGSGGRQGQRGERGGENRPRELPEVKS